MFLLDSIALESLEIGALSMPIGLSSLLLSECQPHSLQLQRTFLLAAGTWALTVSLLKRKGPSLPDPILKIL